MVNIFYLSGNVLDARVAAQGNKTQSLLPAQQPGRELDTETEAPILSPSDVKSQLTGKDPNAGKD